MTKETKRFWIKYRNLMASIFLGSYLYLGISKEGLDFIYLLVFLLVNGFLFQILLDILVSMKNTNSVNKEPKEDKDD